MRLIDADLLTEEIESLRCTLMGIRAGKGILAHAADEYRKTILQIINDQPTAFDKNKVIEELKSPYNYAIMSGRHVTTVDRVVEIVEKGGRE